MTRSSFTELKENFPNFGKIKWIGLRNSTDQEVNQVNSAEMLAGHGLVGDKSAIRKGSMRQITLLQAEHLAAIASFLNRGTVLPAELRRNIVISGINLSILKGYSIQLNNAVVVITGNCAPCNKMEQALGVGGYNAMRNHGGVTATVEKGGIINVGDFVKVLPIVADK